MKNAGWQSHVRKSICTWCPSFRTNVHILITTSSEHPRLPIAEQPEMRQKLHSQQTHWPPRFRIHSNQLNSTTLSSYTSTPPSSCCYSRGNPNTDKCSHCSRSGLLWFEYWGVCSTGSVVTPEQESWLSICRVWRESWADGSAHWSCLGATFRPVTGTFFRYFILH